MIQREFAPFIRTSKNVPYMYLNIIIALFPCICAATFIYGLRVLVMVAVSAFLSFVGDYFVGYIFRGDETKKDYFDLSSIVNGIVFALLLPPDTSITIVIAGVVFGVVLIKQVFGGVGSNLFNTALASRLIVSVLFPNALNGFAKPLDDWFSFGTLFSGPTADAVASDPSRFYILEILGGQYSTFIGTGCIVVIIVGGVYLTFKGIVKIYAPIAYLVTIVALMPVFEGINVLSYLGIRTVVFYMLSSGVFFVATFALTDFTTTPINKYSAIVYGILGGLITAFMADRYDSIYVLCVPVLICNLTIPFLEYCIKYKSSSKRTSLSSVKEGGEDL